MKGEQDTVLVSDSTDYNELLNISKELSPEWLQIHGRISLNDAKKLRTSLPGVKLIKTIFLDDPLARSQAYQFSRYVDMLLLESKELDLELAENIQKGKEIILQMKNHRIPVLIAGGLNSENVSSIVESLNPDGVDINSGLKDAAGKKRFL